MAERICPYNKRRTCANEADFHKRIIALYPSPPIEVVVQAVVDNYREIPTSHLGDADLNLLIRMASLASRGNAIDALNAAIKSRIRKVKKATLTKK